MKFVVVSEDAKSARELISAARANGADEIVVVQCDAAQAAEVAKAAADKVVVANLAVGAMKEAVVSVVIDEARAADAAVVLVGPSRRMVNASAAIAHALDTAPIVDVKKMDDGVASHIKFGGKVVVSEKPVGSYAVYVVPAGSFEAAAADGEACPVEEVEVAAQEGVRVVAKKTKEVSSVDLTAAKRIVCIGRGVNTAEGFEACAELQRAIGGEMGCTRPVTETADPLMPRDTYIGASGLFVKPELFIGIASSGQTQHTMGMYESGTVVVIDKNKDALFFNQCDYGIVGDYQDIVPALVRAMEA